MKLVASTGVPGRYVILRALRPLIIEDARVQTTAYHNLLLDLDLRDWIQLEMYFGLYESPDVRLLRRLVRPGDVAFDVGANVGLYTIALAKSVGPTGHVHAFEPLLSNVKAIHRNVSLNNLQDAVSVNPVAVADPDTPSITLFYGGDELDTGGPSIVPDIGRGLEISVPCVTLDGYIEAHGIDSVRLIKMDIEGSELLALRGLNGAMDRGVVSMIYFETNAFHLRYQGLAPPDVKRFVRSRGYELFALRGERLLPVDEDTPDPKLRNVLAVRKQLVHEERGDVVVA